MKIRTALLAVFCMLAQAFVIQTVFAAEAKKDAAKAAEVKKDAPAPAEAKKEAPKPKILGLGDTIPDFSAQGLDGESLGFKKDMLGKGKLGVLAFMTSSCSACRSELYALNLFKKKYQDNLQVYAVSVDIKGKDSMKPYADEHKFLVTYVMDPEFKIAQNFGIAFTPALIYFDKAGKIIFINKGYKPGDQELIEEKTAELLK